MCFSHSCFTEWKVRKETFRCHFKLPLNYNEKKTACHFESGDGSNMGKVLMTQLFYMRWNNWHGCLMFSRIIDTIAQNAVELLYMSYCPMTQSFGLCGKASHLHLGRYHCKYLSALLSLLKLTWVFSVPKSKKRDNVPFFTHHYPLDLPFIVVTWATMPSLHTLKGNKFIHSVVLFSVLIFAS